MSENYFMGDPHLKHKNITKYRPFDTPEEHDGVIMDSLMSTANKRNTLWLLGDVFFSDECYDFATTLCASYEQVKIVLGNHCTEKTDRLRLLRRLFLENENLSFHGIISKYNTWLTHAPVHPDELRSRVLNIHGHVHYSVIDDPRYLCVSAEMIDFKPISLNTIRGIIEERGLKQ